MFMADLLSHVQEATLWLRHFRFSAFKFYKSGFVMTPQKINKNKSFSIMLNYVLYFIKTIDLRFSTQHWTWK